jgi:L-seryl-tRNA(Ser) seleniumtransferase
MTGQDFINITVFMLQNGEDKLVAKRLQEELAKAAVS